MLSLTEGNLVYSFAAEDADLVGLRSEATLVVLQLASSKRPGAAGGFRRGWWVVGSWQYGLRMTSSDV